MNILEDVVKLLQVDNLKTFGKEMVENCLSDHNESYAALKETTNRIITEINGGFLIPPPAKCKRQSKKRVSAVKTGVRMSERLLKKTMTSSTGKSLLNISRKSVTKLPRKSLSNSIHRKRVSKKKLTPPPELENEAVHDAEMHHQEPNSNQKVLKLQFITKNDICLSDVPDSTKQAKKSIRPNEFTPPHPLKCQKILTAYSTSYDLSHFGINPVASSTPVDGNNKPVSGIENGADFQVNSKRNEMIHIEQQKVTDKEDNHRLVKRKFDFSKPDKENTTPLATSKIPICKTPITNRPSLVRLQQTNSVKKQVLHLEQQCKTPPSTNVKNSMPVRKFSVGGGKDHQIRTTRNMTRSKILTANQESKEKRVLGLTNNRQQPTKEVVKIEDVKTDLGKEDPLKKKDEILKATKIELKRKREERENKAVAAREAAEREKLQMALKAEKEREERCRMKKEKEEKMKEEQLKKKQMAAQKAAEAVEKRKVEAEVRAARLKEIEAEKNNRIVVSVNSKESYDTEKSSTTSRQKLESQTMKEQNNQTVKKIIKQTSNTQQKQKTQVNETFSKNKVSDYGVDHIDENASSEDEDHPKKKLTSWNQKHLMEFTNPKQERLLKTFRTKYYANAQDRHPVFQQIFPTSTDIRVGHVSTLWESRIIS